MKELGRYCTETQMFIENPVVNTGRLRFYRWFAENKPWEHVAEGRPSGEFAMAMVIKENKSIEDIIGKD